MTRPVDSEIRRSAGPPSSAAGVRTSRRKTRAWGAADDESIVQIAVALAPSTLVFAGVVRGARGRRAEGKRPAAAAPAWALKATRLRDRALNRASAGDGGTAARRSLPRSIRGQRNARSHS